MMHQRTLPSTGRETVEVRRDLDATSEFQHVAHVVTEMRERRDPALTAFFAARGLGMSPQELEAMGLPPCPEIECQACGPHP